jgi:tRNA pseudouridine55 synthase
MARRRKGRPVSGWLCLDKALGQSSTQAVGAVRRLFGAAKAGHAGTLDPRAAGILPIALGEATKTVSIVQDGRKVYRFTVRWGQQTATDDTEGDVINQSPTRPDEAAIRGLLPRYVGDIQQRPPIFSAIKVDGERAYDLARDGLVPELAERPVRIDSLDLVEQPDRDHAVFECVCGKGTYVRAMARDMGADLGCYGHVSALRRLVVGPFDEASAVSLAELEGVRESSPPEELDRFLQPIAFGLADLTEIAVGSDDAARLGRGQSVLLRGRDAPVISGQAYATHAGASVALGEVSAGEFHPRRVFVDPS